MRTINLLLAFLLFSAQAFCQDKAPVALSLADAVSYALKNNINVLNADLDLQSAKMRESEIRGIGLPQISGSFDIKNYVQLPTQLLPGEVFGGAPGTFIPVQFGTKYNSTGSIQASQMLFNSDYFVAITSRGTLKELAEKNITRSKIETTVLVTKAYYNVLINRQRFGLMEANVERVRKLKEDTEALYDNGFAEKIDVDRIEVAYNNLTVEKEKVQKFVGLTETLLKFQMGMDINNPIVLTDSITHPENAMLIIDTLQKNYTSRIEYSLAETQKKFSEADLRKNRLSYLPSAFLYGNVSAQQQSNKFEVFNTEKKWFPFSIIGATLNVPIFDGLQKHYRIQQSKLNLLKTENNLKHLQNVIALEVTSSQINYNNAVASLAVQKKNMELAENIFNVAKIKYQEGVGSNLEVINAETSLKESQTNYYNALTEYYISKVDYDKATGTIK